MMNDMKYSIEINIDMYQCTIYAAQGNTDQDYILTAKWYCSK